MLDTANRNVDGAALAIEDLYTKIFDAEIEGRAAPSPAQLASLMAVRFRRLGGRPGNIHVTGARKCFICGEAHDMKECTKTCELCSLPYCQGARGATCVVTCAPSGLPAAFTNALGRPMPEHLVTKLKAARKTHMDKENAVAQQAVGSGRVFAAFARDADSDTAPDPRSIF